LMRVNSVLTLGLLAEKHEDSERFKVFGELHRLCRKLGIDRAYEQFDTLYWHRGKTALLLNWFRSSVPDYLSAHQAELLTDETEVLLDLLLKQRPHWSLRLFRDLVRQARTQGIAKALVEFGIATQRQIETPESQE